MAILDLSLRRGLSAPVRPVRPPPLSYECNKKNNGVSKVKTMTMIGTKEAARVLGISISRLQQAIWKERFQPPAKGPGGAYCWTHDDLQRASWVLLRKPFERQKGVNDAVRNLHK